MKEFQNALSNFVHDVASGGAVRHLADAGYSISEIAAQLDYPLPKEKIAAVIWEHFVNTGRRCTRRNRSFSHIWIRWSRGTVNILNGCLGL